MINLSIKKIPTFFTLYFIAILLLIPKWPGAFGSLQPKTNAIPLLILCTFALFLLLQLNHLRLFLPNRNLLILLLLNIFIISFFRPDMLQSIRHWVAVSLTLVIVLFLTTLLHSIKLQKALLLLSTNLTLSVSLSALVHLITIGKMTFFVHDSLTRVSGLFFFADNAMMASISILLSIIAFLLPEKKTKILPIILFNISVCSLLLASTDTRSAMLSLVIALSFILSFSSARLGTKIILIISAMIIIGSSYSFLHSTENKAENIEKLMIRQMIWRTTINGIKERPMTGFGNKELFLQNDSQSRRISRKLTDAHNAHLMHMLTFGVPSWVLFISFLLAIVWNGLKDFKKETRILHSIIIFWIIVSIFWGRVFLLSSNVQQIILIVSLLGITCHPDAYKRSKSHRRYYIYSVNL